MHITNTVPTSPIPTTSPTTTYPAYYLGRPVAVYQRRYGRRVTASRQLT